MTIERLAAALGGLLLSVTLPAAAQQGSPATQGILDGLTAHDAALRELHPNPIEACGTIDEPGGYVLTGNLTAAGDCLVISADSVSIDLGGWAVIGAGTGAGIEDDGNARRGIAVRNGTVTGFAVGVSLSATTGAIVQAVHASDNIGNGIVGGPGSAIEGNTVSDNGNGILTNVGAIVSGNTVLDNGNHGIQAGEASLISGNTTSGNVGFGIAAGSKSTISGNIVSDNEVEGIFATEANTVIDNTVGENGRDGIRARRGSTISGNTVWQNAGAGVVADCPSNISQNTVTRNAGESLRLNEASGACNLEHNLAP